MGFAVSVAERGVGGGGEGAGAGEGGAGVVRLVNGAVDPVDGAVSGVLGLAGAEVGGGDGDEVVRGAEGGDGGRGGERVRCDGEGGERRVDAPALSPARQERGDEAGLAGGGVVEGDAEAAVGGWLGSAGKQFGCWESDCVP